MKGYVDVFHSGATATMYVCPGVVGTSTNGSPVDRRSGGDENDERVLGRDGEPAQKNRNHELKRLEPNAK